MILSALYIILFFIYSHQVRATQNGRKYVVSQNHRLSSDKNPGTEEKPFKTISKAAALAQAGDTVLVYPGVYREWVAPARGGEENRPVTYIGVSGGKVIVRGSEIYKNTWFPLDSLAGVYYTKVPENFFSSGFNPFKINFSERRGGVCQGQVFIDGKEIPEARRSSVSDASAKNQVKSNRLHALAEEPGTWCTLDGETIFIHLPFGSKPLSESLVEFSVRRHLFAPVRRAQNYINLKGFIFEHCANDASFPQVGAVSCRSGQHWIIENNVIRNIKTIGMDVGAEDEDPWLLPDILPEDRFYVGRHHDIFKLSERRIAGRHLILNNIVSDCGQCGIAGVFSDGTIITGNIVERCGAVVPGFETGGIKIHGLMGGTVEGNLVRDNESWGIWLDCGYIGSRVTRNVAINNKISGIFFECSNGPGLIDNNIIALNRGDGIYTHDASGVSISNNLVFGNQNFGIYMCVATDRLVPPYHYATGLYENEISACSWQRVFNNIITGNAEGAISLPLPSERVIENLTDYNLFGISQMDTFFVMNFRNGDKNDEKAVNEKFRLFQKTGDGGISAVDLLLWKDSKGVALKLHQWQLKTNNDLNSKAINIKTRLNPESFELIVTMDENPSVLNCPPFVLPNYRDFAAFSRKIDKDFNASPMPSGNWLPGPFQKLKSGENRFGIWPVNFTYPDLPPKVCPQPNPDSPGLLPVKREN